MILASAPYSSWKFSDDRQSRLCSLVNLLQNNDRVKSFTEKCVWFSGRVENLNKLPAGALTTAEKASTAETTATAGKLAIAGTPATSGKVSNCREVSTDRNAGKPATEDESTTEVMQQQ
jgi:hypothetical protein